MLLLLETTLAHYRDHIARTLLSLLGVVVGVAAMVATSTVTGSIFDAIRRTVEATAGRADFQLTNGSVGVAEVWLGRIGRLPGVAATSALVEGVVHLEDGNRGGTVLTVFGADFLDGEEYEAQLPRSALRVEAVEEFIADPRAIALSASLAQRMGWDVGDDLPVFAPAGRAILRIAGLVDPVGPAALFGGDVGLMDLEAAQLLFCKADPVVELPQQLPRCGGTGQGADISRVDRIDVRVAADADLPGVRERIEGLVQGAAVVSDAGASGTRSRDLLFSLRVSLSLAGLVACVVGFFIIYHTVRVSIVQRQRHIALLGALGVSRVQVIGWLAIEALAIGSVAALIGVGIGALLAQLVLEPFGGVVTAWIRLPVPRVRVSAATFVLALVFGVGTTTIATLLAAHRLLRTPVASLLRRGGAPAETAWGSSLLALACFSAVAALMVFAPATLPYRSLVLYIFAVNSLSLVAFALLSPLVARLVASLACGCARRSRGLPLLLASGVLERAPAGPVAVVAAIVMGLGWTLADVSLTESFKHSWLRWIDAHYPSDFVVSAGPTTVSFLTAPAMPGDVLRLVREVPGVRFAQGTRTVRAQYGSRPMVVHAVDRSERGFPMNDGAWEEIAGDFWTGGGFVVSDKFAHFNAVRDDLSIPTPRGRLRRAVLGVYADFQHGDLGAVAMPRDLYEEHFGDSTIDTIHVWADNSSGGDVPSLGVALQGTLSGRGLRVTSVANFRARVAALVDDAFAITYALVLIALTISFVGIANFLLAAILDRGEELHTLSALGVPSRQVAVSLVLEGAMIGIVGVAVGLLAGFVSAAIIVRHSVPMVNGFQFDFLFPPIVALRLAAATVALAALAGVFPAQVARRSAAAGTR